MSESEEKLSRQIREENERRRQQANSAVAKARADPGKEQFGMELFSSLYDVTAELGGPPLMRDVERFEQEYYLRHPQVKTVREFADIKRKLAQHDAT